MSARMGGDRVKHAYGGMVHEASRLGRCLEERDLPLEAAFRLETFVRHRTSMSLILWNLL